MGCHKRAFIQQMIIHNHRRKDSSSQCNWEHCEETFRELERWGHHKSVPHSTTGLKHHLTDTEQHRTHPTSHDRGTELDELTAGERKRRRNWNREVVITPCTKQTTQQESNGAVHCPAGAWLTEPCCLFTSSGTKEKKSDWWEPPLPKHVHTQKHEQSFLFNWFYKETASSSILPQFIAAHSTT